MNRRVLIIDDETNIRRMMKLTLEADRYDVEDAADGLTGLELFGDGSRFDAVVLDQKMPGMDGIEDVRQMLRRAPDATIVMVTAFRIDRACGRCDEGWRTGFPEEAAYPVAPQGCAAGGAVETRPTERNLSRPAPQRPRLHRRSRQAYTRCGRSTASSFARCHPATSPPTTSIASSCVMPAVDPRARYWSPSARRKSRGFPGSAGARFRPGNPSGSSRPSER